MIKFKMALFLSLILLETYSMNTISPSSSLNQSKYILVSILRPTPRSDMKLIGFDAATRFKSYIMGKQQREKFEKQLAEIKSKTILKEESERRRIYLQRLLAYQGGSNVLRDFHTNRF